MQPQLCTPHTPSRPGPESCAVSMHGHQTQLCPTALRRIPAAAQHCLEQPPARAVFFKKPIGGVVPPVCCICCGASITSAGTTGVAEGLCPGTQQMGKMQPPAGRRATATGPVSWCSTRQDTVDLGGHKTCASMARLDADCLLQQQQSPHTCMHIHNARNTDDPEATERTS